MSTDRRDDERSGDPAVDQAWRAAANDQPSAQLDATILAAARAATSRAQPRPSTSAKRYWWTHWQPLAAAAGVAGLAFTVVQMLPRDRDLRPAPASETARPERAEVTTQDSAAATEAAERNPASPGAPAAAAPAAADRAKEATSARELPAPEAWARRIEMLHAAGDETAAADALRAFRAAYPDADQYLPESLQPWAGTQQSPAALGESPR
jgi:hypothetical protein